MMSAYDLKVIGQDLKNINDTANGRFNVSAAAAASSEAEADLMLAAEIRARRSAITGLIREMKGDR